MTATSDDYVELPTLKDFDPFAVDPILRWMQRKKLKPAVVWAGSTVAVAAAGALAARDHGLKPARYGRSTLADISTLFTRPKAGTIGSLTVPLLRDYPTVILAFTIATAVPLIYCLFQALSELHSQLAANGCLEIRRDCRAQDLEDDIDELNAKMASRSRPRCFFAVNVVAFLMVALMLTRQSRGGFFYLASPSEHVTHQLYLGWWARPYSPGFFVASIIGSLGVYFVYVEAVIGVNYVRFIRKHRDTYHFRANQYNIDGQYGWSVLGRAYTYMLAGIATTAVSIFALYYFLEPELWRWLIVGMLGAFFGIVCYVSIASSIILRGDVMVARDEACNRLVEQLEKLRDADAVNDLLRRQILTDELGYCRDIPSFPLRGSGAYAARIVTVVGFVGTVQQVYAAWKH